MATRIMVVNDSREILELFEEILTEEGYEVDLYSYGVHDLLEVKESRPDMIILDYLIGDEGYGWQLLQKLKMDRDTEHIPVIVCSGAVKLLRVMDAWLAEKGVGVVFKPFNIDDLLVAVHKMLEGSPAVLGRDDGTGTSLASRERSKDKERPAPQD
jgi:DNA-binding response OmpR family regulator